MSSIKIRSKRQTNSTQIRVLISHAMARGDASINEPKPAAIQILTITLNQKVVVSCELGDSTPKNPFFAFVLKNAHKGDKVTVNWLDSRGYSDSEEHIIN